MVPPGNAKKLDGPGVFRRGNLWFMVYSLYDNTGYETWLAQSTDLLNWTIKGRLMSASDAGKWDASYKAGYIALQDVAWEGSYEWQKYNNRYWMSYTGGNTRNGEGGPFSIGMSYSYQAPTGIQEWRRPDQPVLSSADALTRKADNTSLYKSFVLRDSQQFTGHPFVMYYTATGDSLPSGQGTGSINIAVSDDMLHWQRYGNAPVVSYNSGGSGDPTVQKIDNLYVMFYNGASNRFACSYDLINWTDWLGQELIKPSEPYDDAYIRKSSVIKYKGVVYHFYCASNKKEQQGIAVATSVNIGKSDLAFSR